MNIKRLGKAFLCRLLEGQVKRLRIKNKFLLVAVAGSAGKTSTKLAIAQTLNKSRRVIFQSGNYNDRLTVPLILFDRQEPAIFNIFAWISILIKNELSLQRQYQYDFAVVELGTDAPGQLIKFAYLKPDIIVITSVSVEHMENFAKLEAVAKEEMVPVSFSAKTLLNADDIAKYYLPDSRFVSYGLNNADYALKSQEKMSLDGQNIEFILPADRSQRAEVNQIGDQGAKIVIAAVAVADMLGLTADEIQQGLKNIRPVAGRMQILNGKNSSTLIDDSYNATPAAMTAALKVLQDTEAPQRIAILGSMNELGKDSAELHKAVGEQCDPSKLDLVVTVGQIANDQLAPIVAGKNIQVESFLTPYEAGKFVNSQIKPGAVILAKGSQNGVFLEEAIKLLLENPSDSTKLVRQSPYWLKQKQKYFDKLSG